ncbi:hypothetical protein PInf_007536 [Phytophthora infestans]|nr:hypothetical protein PInf_007536 [Phytophthora infestans]
MGFSFMELPVNQRVVVISILILLFGLFFGLSLDANAHIPKPWNRVSSIIGWIYFFCWSVSFYPQVFLNRQRRSVVGLSLDYTVLNMLGFTCYSIFNQSVQEQYMRRHDGHRNAVELNDVFFSLHAAVLVAVSLFQCAIYPRGGQVVSKPTMLWTGATFVAAVVFGLAVFYVKLMTTLVKCLPQIALNYQRKSTQLLDSAATNDWTAMTGDPVKFSLGFVSIIVDVVFILQHYVFYADNNNFMLHGGETKPFLPK